MVLVVVMPDGADPVQKQRVEWGQNISDLLDTRRWTRKQLAKEIEDAYGLKVSAQAISQWIKGDTAPSTLFQSAIAGVAEVPHRFVFPPIQLCRRNRGS